jgi:hypothetical protein
VSISQDENLHFGNYEKHVAVTDDVWLLQDLDSIKLFRSIRCQILLHPKF